MALSTSGDNNVAIGSGALGGAVFTGQGSVSVGVSSGSASTLGSSNTFIGTSAGFNTTIGSNNICLGRQATTAAVGDDNQISIGSATYFVGTLVNSIGYYTSATATSTGVLPATCGFWRVIINGSARKIPVYED